MKNNIKFEKSKDYLDVICNKNIKTINFHIFLFIILSISTFFTGFIIYNTDIYFIIIEKRNNNIIVNLLAFFAVSLIVSSCLVFISSKYYFKTLNRENLKVEEVIRFSVFLLPPVILGSIIAVSGIVDLSLERNYFENLEKYDIFTTIIALLSGINIGFIIYLVFYAFAKKIFDIFNKKIDKTNYLRKKIKNKEINKTGFSLSNTNFHQYRISDVLTVLINSYIDASFYMLMFQSTNLIFKREVFMLSGTFYLGSLKIFLPNSLMFLIIFFTIFVPLKSKDVILVLIPVYNVRKQKINFIEKFRPNKFMILGIVNFLIIVSEINVKNIINYFLVSSIFVIYSFVLLKASLDSMADKYSENRKKIAEIIIHN